MSPNPESDSHAALIELSAGLRARFLAAEFTADSVAAHLGPEINEAFHRGEPGAVASATADDSALSRMIRLFLLRRPTPLIDVERLLGSGQAEALIAAEAAVRVGTDQLQVVLDFRPHVLAGQNYWVVSDADSSMTAHIPGPDHVLGVGSASVSLLQATPVSKVGTVLDLGTGSGALALSQVESASAITATDIHPRALSMAAATLAINGVTDRVELLRGPWFEPVRGRRFDRIVANPPFVVGLPEVNHVYRDSGLNLDGATELVVSEAAEHLNEGGTAHLLGAWIHPSDGSWRQRLASWLPKRGVDAWVMQRDIVDPALYVSTWLRDESLDPRSKEAQERTINWLWHFAEHDVNAIGFGFIAIREIGDRDSEVLVEDIRQPFTDPLGPEVEEYFRRSAWLRERGHDDIANARFQVREGVAKEDIALADAEAGVGFARAAARVTRTEGPRWSHEVDAALSAVISGLHPNGLDLAETVGLYAAANGIGDDDTDELVTAAVAAVVDLVRHGLLVPGEWSE